MSKDKIFDPVMDAALQWYVRLHAPEMDSQAWIDFADWLEQDERHNAAYDEVVQADGDLEQWVELQEIVLEAAIIEPANDRAPVRRWYAFGGIGLAASIMLAILLWPQLSGPEFRTIATKPGQTEMVQLDDGSRIQINGDSELTLKSDDQRYAKLVRGEAIFHVEHDARNPFTVYSGGYELVDRGTIFNVKSVPGEFSVGVSEGAVLLKGERKLVDIQAGKILTIDADGQSFLQAIEPENIGAWTRSQLIYDLAPIAKVITDVNRSTGLSLTVDPDVANRSFSGTIQLQKDDSQMILQLKQLLDVQAQDTASGWHLTQ